MSTRFLTFEDNVMYTKPTLAAEQGKNYPCHPHCLHAGFISPTACGYSDTAATSGTKMFK
eukprot:705123-Amphidinium_carterae.1